MEKAMKTYKATIRLGDHTDEVTIYAPSLEEALQKADEKFGEDAVTRMRPVVAPNIDRFGVTL